VPICITKGVSAWTRAIRSSARTATFRGRDGVPAAMLSCNERERLTASPHLGATRGPQLSRPPRRACPRSNRWVWTRFKLALRVGSRSLPRRAGGYGDTRMRSRRPCRAGVGTEGRAKRSGGAGNLRLFGQRHPGPGGRVGGLPSCAHLADWPHIQSLRPTSTVMRCAEPDHVLFGYVTIFCRHPVFGHRVPRDCAGHSKLPKRQL
jgi:hypothetical protein